MSLFEIDRLIRKTEYDEALRQLNIYMDNNPEQFDNVQNRIGKIMNAKIRYSELAEELLDIIRNDPTNNKKIYEITAELEKFERHPSDENLKFIADLKKSAEFNYFRAQFLEIQNAVAENVQDGNYVSAVKKAQEGFWLYKDNFYVKWEDNAEVISQVDSLVGHLTEHLLAFENKNFIPEISKVINDFIKSVKLDQYDGATRKFNDVKTQMSRYNNLRADIINDKEKMEAFVQELQKIDTDMSDASYLPFLIHFITGSEAIDNSGILRALEHQWNDFVADMNNAVFELVTKKYNSFQEGLNQDFINELEKYVKLEGKVLALYDIPNAEKSTEIENPLTDYYMLTKYVTRLSREVVNTSSILAAIDNNGVVQNEIISLIQGEGTLNEKNKYINQLFNNTKKLEEIVHDRDTFDSEYLVWSGPYKSSEYENWDKLTELYESTVENIFENKSLILNKSWDVVTKYYMARGDYLYKDIADFAAAADTYNKGFITKIPEEAIRDIKSNISKASYYEKTLNENKDLDLGIYYKYPDITMDMVVYVQNEAKVRVKEINSYIKELDKMINSEKSWAENESLTEKVNYAKEFLNKQIGNIEKINLLITNTKNTARNLIVNAELAKNEADLRFAEAERALKKEDFGTARRKLQNALSKYDEALNNQNNEKLRSEWDNKLQKLGDEIARTENELIVREVRELKNLAKDAYFNGRFDDAEKYLNQASTKWAITNVTEDPEITNLRNFVNTAISMKTGREILPSAPQYPEMSQLMNIARQSYDEGSKLLKAGNKDEAMKQFEVALNSIQKVQYVYPLNQEAALLTLQINKISDPQKFEEEFAKKIEVAEMLCKSADTQQEGYANLLDYYQLDPDYPGLKKLIYNVEIDIGIRQKPVDNSGKNKAKRYIADAEKLYKKAGNDLEKLNNALEKVNDALTLLPYDEEAMDLKDKITTKMGGNASTVLSTEDERLYQLAIQRLQNNNVVGANAIVDELLKKPQNRYSQKIKDLKNKIDARS